MSTEEINVKTLLDKYFKGKRFRSQDLKNAGRALQRNDVDKAIEILTEANKKFGDSPGNLQPPAKGKVLFTSRDFAEWPVVKASAAIQKYIYAAKKDDVDRWSGKENSQGVKEYPKKLTTKPEQEKWFKETGVNNHGCTDVQLLGKVFPSSLNRYKGFITKAENRNKKLEKKALKRGKPFQPEPIFDDEGYLIKKTELEPIGINPNIYCAQPCKVRPLTEKDLENLNIKIPNEYEKCELSPASVIKTYGFKNRIHIPKGQPGWIPPYHRENLNHNKRVKMYGNTNDKSLLVVAQFGDDWAVCDVRGLLRNARYRKVVDNTCTLDDLMNLFTKDPVIDADKKEITFIYKEGVVNVRKKNVIKGKRTKEVLEELTADNSSIALASIDLGQINPVSVGLYKVSKKNDELKTKHISSFVISSESREELIRYRVAYDAMEADIENQAFSEINANFQKEFKSFEENGEHKVKESICNSLSLNESELNWKGMSSNSYNISDAIIKNGDKEKAYRTFKDKSGKEKQKKISDWGWYCKFRPRVKPEARKALNEKIWSIKRDEPRFKKLSVRKQEVTRHITNEVIKRCKELSKLDDVVLSLENLVMDNRFASGSGKRDKGWHNFFKRKSENRWFLQALNKAFMEHAAHHGLNVCEVSARYTSQTCPKCSHCSKESRSKSDRELFTCINCGVSLNADIDVATHNIMHVTVTGESLPGPEKIERSSAKKKPVPSRTSKNKAKTNTSKKSVEQSMVV